MTYHLEILRTTFKGDGEYTKHWDPVEVFEDKELAWKEFQKISAAWFGTAVYRLIEQ